MRFLIFATRDALIVECLNEFLCKFPTYSATTPQFTAKCAYAKNLLEKPSYLSISQGFFGINLGSTLIPPQSQLLQH